jgi:phytoene synthase
LAGRTLLPAVVDAVRRFHVPPEHLRAAIDGVEMDLRRAKYETFDDLREYCLRVASAVGLACIHIWGFSGREAIGPAEECGIALQLTNILRDLREDAEAERVYLPEEDLRACGLGREELLCGVADRRFDQLMELEIARAEGYYQRGSRLIDYLEPGGRRVFGVMMATYRSLLARIKRHPRAVLARRIRLTRGEKLRIVARWALLPPKAAALA